MTEQRYPKPNRDSSAVLQLWTKYTYEYKICDHVHINYACMDVHTLYRYLCHGLETRLSQVGCAVIQSHFSLITES